MNNSEANFASAKDTFIQSVVAYAGSTAMPKAKEYEAQGSRFYDEVIIDIPKRKVFCRVMGLSDDTDIVKLAQSYVCYLKGATFKKRFNDELNELRKIEFEREFAEKHMYTKEYALLEDQCFRYHDMQEQKALMLTMLTDEFERELKR
ncbi:MAG: hypothetical protein KDD62_11390 [Bdellovibrionales bacterium]|nr:hypothetical protein [Bdellovibrionales bacterium]